MWQLGIKIGFLVILCLCKDSIARSGKEFKVVEDDDVVTTPQLLKDDKNEKGKVESVTTTTPCPTTTTEAASGDGTNDTKTLVMVNVVFRHGDKFKEQGEYYNRDPYKIEDPFWLPFGLGQLRNIGKQRTYWLGLFLRMKYGGFLRDEYFYKDIRMTSADTDKNFMSALLVLLGLYPPKGINIWNDNVGRFFQPIPVHGIQADLDHILNQITCQPYYDELLKIFKKDLADMNLKNKDLFEDISKSSGNNITHLGELFQIYNIMRIEHENGRILPEWVKNVYPSKVKPIALKTYDYLVKTDFMKIIKSGPLLNLLLSDMNRKINKTLDPNYKIKLYSTSDITLMSLLNTLGVDESLDPEYGATVLIELHKIQEKYYVKMNYMDNGFKKRCTPLKFKGYDGSSVSLIPFEKFHAVNSKYMIDEESWYKMCNIPYC